MATRRPCRCWPTLCRIVAMHGATWSAGSVCNASPRAFEGLRQWGSQQGEGVKEGKGDIQFFQTNPFMDSPVTRRTLSAAAYSFLAGRDHRNRLGLVLLARTQDGLFCWY